MTKKDDTSLKKENSTSLKKENNTYLFLSERGNGISKRQVYSILKV